MFRELAVASVLTLGASDVARSDGGAAADSSYVEAPQVYLGVSSGPTFGDYSDGGEDGYVLSGVVAYSFPVGLWLEYEGGVGVYDDTSYEGWTKLGWRLADPDGPWQFVVGYSRIGLDAPHNGLWVSSILDLGPTSAVRLSVEGSWFPGDAFNDVDVAPKVGFFLVP
jgi:hypothetical protein